MREPIMSRVGGFCGIILVLLSVLVATEGIGFAQTEDLRKELDADYQNGMTFYKQGKYAEAARNFERAVALTDQVFWTESPEYGLAL